MSTLEIHLNEDDDDVPDIEGEDGDDGDGGEENFPKGDDDDGNVVDDGPEAPALELGGLVTADEQEALIDLTRAHVQLAELRSVLDKRAKHLRQQIARTRSTLVDAMTKVHPDVLDSVNRYHAQPLPSVASIAPRLAISKATAPDDDGEGSSDGDDDGDTDSSKRPVIVVERADPLPPGKRGRKPKAGPAKPRAPAQFSERVSAYVVPGHDVPIVLGAKPMKAYKAVKVETVKAAIREATDRLLRDTDGLAELARRIDAQPTGDAVGNVLLDVVAQYIMADVARRTTTVKPRLVMRYYKPPGPRARAAPLVPHDVDARPCPDMEPGLVNHLLADLRDQEQQLKAVQGAVKPALDAAKARKDALAERVSAIMERVNPNGHPCPLKLHVGDDGVTHSYYVRPRTATKTTPLKRSDVLAVCDDALQAKMGERMGTLLKGERTAADVAHAYVVAVRNQGDTLAQYAMDAITARQDANKASRNTVGVFPVKGAGGSKRKRAASAVASDEPDAKRQRKA
jgi:hypothetical protein